MSAEGTGRLEIEHDGRRLVVAAAVVVVGRHRANGLRVVHPLVSREHCRIDLRADGAFLTDLGSTNGTFLNGTAVGAETRLRADDRITLGREGALLLVRAASLDGADLFEDEADRRTVVEGAPGAAAAVARVTAGAGEPPRPAETGDEIVLVAAGREIRVRRGDATIGRSDDCDVVVDDGLVSRRHCDLVLRPQGLFVRDLASRHGTWIGDREIDGESIVRGRTVLALGRAGPRVEVLRARLGSLLLVRDGRTVEPDDTTR